MTHVTRRFTAKSGISSGTLRSAGAVFKGEGVTGSNPPRNVEEKIFGNVKKHAERNASADALYVCTIVMPGKAVWRV